jgi:predicted nucleic acid-binding Zn ribbon protein
MPVVAILLGLGLLIATLPLVVAPLRRSPQGLVPAPAPSDHAASPTHTQVLLALRELEFDHQTGKVAPEDYASLRAELVAQTASVIQAEDAAEERLSERIEEAVRLRRASRTDGDRCRMCGKRLEPGDRFCPTCGHAAQTGCPKCGTDVAPGDQFCSRCGEPVAHPAPVRQGLLERITPATPISRSPT